ncbi:MAG: DUF2726 domain-containing protein [Firmicutes bacterium]|nr:DUF2726 domain-containing protein [Bacillota bacterium]
MDYLHWLILAGVAAAIVVVLILLFKTDVSPVTFKVKRFFISGQRRKCWLALQKAVGQEYMVLAQVPLTAIIEAGGEESKGALAWLEKRWADFVVFEEKLLKPVAVVQIEGHGQDPLWPQGKDPQLQKVLASAGLPLLWLPSDQYQHVELLRHALEQVIDARKKEDDQRLSQE